jgi:hypothetical protein
MSDYSAAYGLFFDKVKKIFSKFTKSILNIRAKSPNWLIAVFASRSIMTFRI